MALLLIVTLLCIRIRGEVYAIHLPSLALKETVINMCLKSLTTPSALMHQISVWLCQLITQMKLQTIGYQNL